MALDYARLVNALVRLEGGNVRWISDISHDDAIVHVILADHLPDDAA